MHITNGYPELAINAKRKYSKSQKLDFDWSDFDEERAEYWVRISAMCCRSNELTVYRNAIYEENLKP